MKLYHNDAAVMLATDGHLYANAASISRSARAGRRTIRCVALTLAEEAELRHRIGSLSGDLLVGLIAIDGGAR